MNEMVERVARAIEDAIARDWPTEAVRLRSRDTVARAAISAMREPTEAMVMATKPAWGLLISEERVAICHRAMIDATLETEK